MGRHGVGSVHSCVWPVVSCETQELVRCPLYACRLRDVFYMFAFYVCRSRERCHKCRVWRWVCGGQGADAAAQQVPLCAWVDGSAVHL